MGTIQRVIQWLGLGRYAPRHPAAPFYPTLNPWRGALPQRAAQATQPPAPPHTPTPAPTRAPAPDGAISDSEGGHHD